MITVYVKRITNITESENQSIIASLSAAARERLNKKRNGALHLASLNALSLLSDEQRKNIYYSENGRPYFKDFDADISISHSETQVAVAISDSIYTSVGVDIEDIKSIPIPTRFLTENEKKLLENGTPYLEIWTKKEALFKFLKNDSTPFIQLDSTQPQKHNARFVTVRIENSILTVCAHENEKIEIVQK